MSVAAYDGTYLAADTLISGGDSGNHYGNKIFRVGRRLLAGTGAYDEVLEVRDWVRAGMPKDARPTLTDFNGILILPDGGVLKLEQRLVPFPIFEHIAVGSGAPYAMTAMDLGRDAREAVRCAIRRDNACGGKVKWIRVRP